MKLRSLLSNDPAPSRWNKKEKQDVRITFKAGCAEEVEDDSNLAIFPTAPNKKKNRTRKQKMSKKEEEELDLLLDKRNASNTFLKSLFYFLFQN